MTSQPNPTNQPRIWRRTALAAVLLAGTALGGCTIGHAAPTPAMGSQPPAVGSAPSSPAAEATGTAVNPPGAITPQATLPNFTHLVEQVKPAVVSITNKLRNPEAMDHDQQAQTPQLPFPC